MRNCACGESPQRFSRCAIAHRSSMLRIAPGMTTISPHGSEHPLPLGERVLSEAKAGEGSLSADADPSSGADCVRTTFSHKGGRKRSPRIPVFSDSRTQSRGANLARVMPTKISARKQRAWGMPGARCTRGRACRVESTRVSHHEYTGITRHSRTRMVLTVSFALSLVTGLVCHHRRRDAKHHRQLDASVGASGPHDFAVRNKRARQPRRLRPPHPAPNEP